MRVLLFAYGQLGAEALGVLSRRGDEVLAVVTHRDDPREERWFVTPAEKALALGLPAPVVYAEDEDDASLAALAARLSPDLILSVFYRRLLPRGVLRAARIAALNLHPSLLPAYRGRAPINWVLVRGERETGVTLHHMVSRADAGDIVLQRAIAIAPRETALSLTWKAVRAGRALLEEALPLVAAGTAPRAPQDEARASTFGRRGPEDGRIDWAWPVQRIDRLVRAVQPPWPGAFGEVYVEGVGPTAIRVHEGEPHPDPVLPIRAPGHARVAGSALDVAAGDGWFRVADWAPMESAVEARA